MPKKVSSQQSSVQFLSIIQLHYPISFLPPPTPKPHHWHPIALQNEHPVNDYDVWQANQTRARNELKFTYAVRQRRAGMSKQSHSFTWSAIKHHRSNINSSWIMKQWESSVMHQQIAQLINNLNPKFDFSLGRRSSDCVKIQFWWHRNCKN